MKKLIIMTFIIVFAINIFANELNLQILGGSSNGFYNSINAAAIDVDNPNNQPIIFNVIVNKLSSEIINNAYIHFSLSWNNNSIINNSKAEFTQHSLDILNQGQSLNVNNRDLIRNDGSSYLHSAIPSLSLSDFLNNNQFKNSILDTGLFPDGIYTFSMIVKNDNGQIISNEAVFNMTISNIYSIRLISPGTPAGSSITNVSGSPLVFLWNSNIINPNNKFTLIIREYSHETAINISNLDNSGRLFYQAEDLMSPLFNNYLPFINDNYYAWKITMPKISDRTEFGINDTYDSSWNIFKFSRTTEESANQYQSISDFLTNLQNPLINELFDEGVFPTGNFYSEDISLTYPQALSILQQLLNAEIISIEIIE
ncbi:MAG: hypothetical protein PHY08_05710 [Candidatus Cloacimonetes bacterium]|jgi:hypothetical protein|nr:hypothetical protein [Candidatus Cloacimonadota bacterium]MDD4156053.1 hypothetical protein [Candidatus Cloacimonadota bacterium]